MEVPMRARRSPWPGGPRLAAPRDGAPPSEDSREERRMPGANVAAVCLAILVLLLVPLGLVSSQAPPSGALQRPSSGTPPPLVPAAAYVANEASGTISVIDTATDTIVGTICLGSDPAIAGTPQPNGPCNAEAQHHN